MTQDEHDVTLRYPDAYDVYNADKGTFKIYRRINGVAVAISESFVHLFDAWANAAALIQYQEYQPIAPLHEGEDGR